MVRFPLTKEWCFYTMPLQRERFRYARKVNLFFNKIMQCFSINIHYITIHDYGIVEKTHPLTTSAVMARL